MSSSTRKQEDIIVEDAVVVTHEITRHPDQVAGHGDLLKDNVMGTVYKPIISVERFFYESAEKNPQFVPFIPQYKGVVTVHRDGRVCQYISLEDISHVYKKPCIMDIKMGISQHLENMSEEKKALAVAKCKNSTSYGMGFRICGIKVYNKEKQEYASWDRFWGRDVPPEEIVPAVNKFFMFAPHFRSDLIDYYSAEIAKLLPIMKQQAAFRFVSSSLLFMYEGDTTNKADLNPQMKMIDFANTLPLNSSGRNEVDEGYPMGLSNIINVFNQIKELPIQ